MFVMSEDWFYRCGGNTLFPLLHDCWPTMRIRCETTEAKYIALYLYITPYKPRTRKMHLPSYAHYVKTVLADAMPNFVITEAPRWPESPRKNVALGFVL